MGCWAWALARSMLLAALASLSACNQLPSYRYRLSVEVETPEGVRTGSSVIEVKSRQGAAFPGPEAGSLVEEVRGEAVVVDLGSRGTLFALLRHGDGSDGVGRYAWALLPKTNGGRRETQEEIAAIKAVRGPVELEPHMYPMLVRFRDLSEPTSVELVEPGRLSATFGPGIRLRRITVEITDAPLTTGIGKRLNWLGKYPEPALDPHFEATPTPPLPQTLRHGDFLRT